MNFSTFLSPAINYRLGLALLLSAVLHGVVILSIGRANILLPSTKNPLSLLEITLVPQKQEQISQKPDSLTQDKTTSESEREEIVPSPPTTNAPSPLPPSEAYSKPAAQLLPTASVVSTTEKKIPDAKAEILSSEQTVAPQLTAQKQAPRLTNIQQSDLKSVPLAAKELASPKSRPSARELIAALEGQLAKEAQHYAYQPRKRYIDSSTSKYAATAYLDAWRKKIERIGKMSYPEEAKRQGLSGSLTLAVDLNADGTVADIVVRRSSGYKTLDKAAIQIVHLAAPFAKVPETVLRGYDILSITRTWQFHSGQDFNSS
jgi:protein TonB